MRNITARTAVAVASFLLGVIVTIPVLAQSHHVLVKAEGVKWAPAPPFLPVGAELSVLEGDPHEKGPVTLRLKFPANYDIPAHWHSMTERVTVLSGALNVGMGDKLDRKTSQRLDPGGFVSLPGKMNHFAWTTTPTIVQINLEGPFDIFYMNPVDDPQQRQSTR